MLANSFRAHKERKLNKTAPGDANRSPLPQTPKAKTKPLAAVGGDSEELRPPMSAAVSPTDNPPVLPTPVQPPRMPVLAPPVTPARSESLQTIFARLDRSRDGQLDQAEVGQMLALLRAQATDATADEEWLQPSDEEIASAMREMDLDRSGTVAFDEFQSWWLRKNHDGEFASSPAMWGMVGASDDEDHDEDKPAVADPATEPASPSLLPPIAGTTPPDAVVIDIAPPASDDAMEWDGDESHREVVALFRKMDSNGSGSLERSEISSLIIHLRAKAMGSDADEEWLHPSDEEVGAAMEFMDLDGNGTVSLEEFLEWWEVKGGWEYAGDPAEWD